MRKIILILALVLSLSLYPCSGFNKTVGDRTLVAGNMDWMNPYSQLYFKPGSDNRYGVIYLGYGKNRAIANPGGINEEGLALDFFSLEPTELKKSIFRPDYNGHIYEDILEKCKTVKEALKVIKRYERNYLISGQMLITDKTGDSAIVETNRIIRKKGDSQAITNFRLSEAKSSSYSCDRYNFILNNIDKEDFSVEGFSRILNGVKMDKKSYGPTQYSYVFDLNSGKINLYLFGDFNQKLELSIEEELKKGERVVDMSSYFNNESYDSYLKKYRMLKPNRRAQDQNLEILTGKYSINIHNMREEIEIRSEDGRLYMMGHFGEYEMLSYGKGKFYSEVLDHKLAFIGNDGDELMLTHRVWGNLIGKRIP